MKQIFKNYNILAIIVSIAIIVILFMTSSMFRVLNKTIQNEYYSVKNELIGGGVNSHIIIVEIDDESFDKIGTFPFPRSVYAQAIENISLYNPAVIAFDLLFLDASTPEEDSLFVQSFHKAHSIVLGASQDGKNLIQTPFAAIPTDTYTTGFLHPQVEKSNKTVYSFTPIITDAEGKTYEHFTLQILRAFYSYLYDEEQKEEVGSLDEGYYNFSQDVSIPLSSKDSHEILINFTKPDNFHRISFADVYNEKSLMQLNQKFNFQDSIILFGPAAQGLKDDFFTPNGVEYGVNIHANILNTLLSKSYMTYFDAKLEWIMIFFIVILSVSVNLSTSKQVLFFSNILIILVFWFLIPLSIIVGTHLILNFPSEIIFSLILSVSSANIIKYIIENKNKQKLNKALSEYVGVNIAHEILNEQGDINFDGEEKELLCFFSDIEGFTHLSEVLSPKELVSFLRSYLSIMTSVIMDKKGYVDKFEGDAIMALWGAFGDLETQDYLGACESALIQQEKLSELNVLWNHLFHKDIKVRMGIHSGNAIVGNIGAIGKKMDFTALGDNINLASRLEGVNKYYDTYICVSEKIYEKTNSFYSYRYLDEIQVQGKDIPVKIYELLGRVGEIDILKIELYKNFQDAVELYKTREFQAASKIFGDLIQKDDSPSKMYYQRCQLYIQNPPSEDWSAIWKMQEK